MAHRALREKVAPEQEITGSLHQRQGIGAWAVRQARAIARQRGHPRLQLRVYAENPARALYARLGFAEEAVIDGTLHMAWVASRSGAA
ncbi:GNAT family N-acetyltransferase [Luteimonas granuli]|uniref:GNAT family N-acetyltransferase n=1 Tax=Luteimonas granuli TaxID=1176533 RepID=UPI002482C196|nr:GNAT family N-acetyltransferase [Luteimonas granuli]